MSTLWGTDQSNGYVFLDKSRKNCEDIELLSMICEWAAPKKIDVVVWTNLKNNFETESLIKKPFSVENAELHVQLLDAKGKAEAAKYVWRAPDFVDTPVRKRLQSLPWFKAP